MIPGRLRANGKLTRRWLGWTVNFLLTDYLPEAHILCEKADHGRGGPISEGGVHRRQHYWAPHAE